MEGIKISLKKILLGSDIPKNLEANKINPKEKYNQILTDTAKAMMDAILGNDQISLKYELTKFIELVVFNQDNQMDKMIESNIDKEKATGMEE